MYQFTCIETFYSDEMKSTYLRGMVYTVRPDDHADERVNVARRKLNDLVQAKWLDENKVILGNVKLKDVDASNAGNAVVSGAGEIKDKETKP